MDWITLIANVVLGTLIPSMLLWVIGKKVQYDFEFWKLLLITGTAALTKQIPYAGLWISLPVYYGLFCKFTGIDFIEAMWMTFLAFLSCAAVGFALMMYAGSLYANQTESESLSKSVVAMQPIPDEQPPAAPAPEDIQPAPPPVLKAVPAKPAAIAPGWLKQNYTLSGIAQSSGQKRAVINGKIIATGETLEPGIILKEIHSGHVILEVNGQLHRLKIYALERSDK